mgnify:CR=1 FL=1
MTAPAPADLVLARGRVPSELAGRPVEGSWTAVSVSLLADRSAFEEFDVDAAAARGMAFEHLDQLAMDHLLGARG